MATDDVTTIESPCPCGQGQISVTQTSPDHPWVKASQISYDAALDCRICATKYQVENSWGGMKPRLVLRVQLNAKAAAEAEVRKVEASVIREVDVGIIKEQLIGLMDAEKTKAAKHRMAGTLGLYPPSYATFIKQPTDGRSLLGRLSGYNVIHAGLRAGLKLPPAVAAGAAEIERLRRAAYAMKVDTVKTGATWMAA